MISRVHAVLCLIVMALATSPSFQDGASAATIIATTKSSLSSSSSLFRHCSCSWIPLISSPITKCNNVRAVIAAHQTWTIRSQMLLVVDESWPRQRRRQTHLALLSSPTTTGARRNRRASPLSQLHHIPQKRRRRRRRLVVVTTGSTTRRRGGSNDDDNNKSKTNESNDDDNKDKDKRPPIELWLDLRQATTTSTSSTTTTESLERMLVDLYVGVRQVFDNAGIEARGGTVIDGLLVGPNFETTEEAGLSIYHLDTATVGQSRIIRAVAAPSDDERNKSSSSSSNCNSSVNDVSLQFVATIQEFEDTLERFGEEEPGAGSKVLALPPDPDLWMHAIIKLK